MDFPRLFNKIGDLSIGAYYRLRYPLSAPERIMDFGGMKMHIRRGTSDLYVAREVFANDTYGIVPHGIVVDLGGNVGAFSLLASKTAERVFVFEPESANFGQIRKNIALNGSGNITPHKKAVGGTHGTARLYKLPSNRGAHSLTTRVSSEYEDVDVITLEEAFALCGIDHIDCLKVDIEGSEYALFEHASDEALQKIDTIVMEIHPVSGKHAKDLIDRLEKAGFAVKRRRTLFTFFGLDIVTARR